MPELAASYVLGATITSMVFAFILFREYRILKSPAYHQLQKNLQQIQLRWSDSMDKIVDMHLPEGLGFMKSMGIFGVFCIFLSWLGLFFFLLIYVSIRVFSHSPRQHLLQSALGEKSLNADQIQSLLHERTQRNTR